MHQYINHLFHWHPHWELRQQVFSHLVLVYLIECQYRRNYRLENRFKLIAHVRDHLLHHLHGILSYLHVAILEAGQQSINYFFKIVIPKLNVFFILHVVLMKRVQRLCSLHWLPFAKLDLSSHVISPSRRVCLSLKCCLWGHVSL